MTQFSSVHALQSHIHGTSRSAGTHHAPRHGVTHQGHAGMHGAARQGSHSGHATHTHHSAHHATHPRHQTMRGGRRH